MNKFIYKITIEAASEPEADSKLKSLVMLAKKLRTNELAKLAEVIEKDPVKTALAKKYLGV
jgi:hypothetical protein